MTTQQDRERQAIESFLGNETLTADVDDDTANELIDWGISCIRKIFGHKESESHDILKTCRKMIRRINTWIASQPLISIEENANMLREIMRMAQIIYGPEYKMPKQVQQRDYLQQIPKLAEHPVKMVLKLRMLLEDSEDFNLNSG